MNASTTRFTWCLLAAAAIGPLAFLGCFPESVGVCPSFEHDFSGCFLDSSGMLWFDDEPENEMCFPVTGGGTGLLHEASGPWSFSGYVSQEDWGMHANLTITYRLRPDDEDVFTIPSAFAVIRSDEDGGKYLRLGLSYLSTNTNLDPPSSNTIVAIQQDLPYVGEECPPITAITSLLPTVVEGWQIFRPPTEWFLQDDGPQAWVSIEAENYHFNQAGEENREWQLSTHPDGYSGEGNMEAIGPAVTDEDIENTIPRLDYNIKFAENALPEAGDWASGQVGIFLQMWAYGAQTGVIAFGLDGVYQNWTAADPTISNYGWYGYPVHGINVDGPGIHTLNLWMNDAGVKVDRIVLGRFANKPTDQTAPPESPEETWLDDD